MLISSVSDLLIVNLFVKRWNVFGAMGPLQCNTTASNSTFPVLCGAFIQFNYFSLLIVCYYMLSYFIDVRCSIRTYCDI